MPHAPSRSRRELSDALVARLRSCEPQERAAVEEELILVNRGVAEAVEARYAHRGLPAEDVRQVACEALVKAVRRFDPPHAGKDLLSYAVPTISGEVKRYFRDHSWAVRPPRRVQELQQRLGPVREALGHELGREPTTSELCGRLGVGEEEYAAAVAAHGCFTPLSLDQPHAETGRTLGDGLAVSIGSDAAVEARVVLAPLVRGLSWRERRILHLRFCEDLTQSEIGARLGITQTQVSRLLAGLVEGLRRALDEVSDELADDLTGDVSRGVRGAAAPGRRGPRADAPQRPAVPAPRRS